MGIQNNLSLENVVTKLSVYFSAKKYSSLNEYTCIDANKNTYERVP